MSVILALKTQSLHLIRVWWNARAAYGREWVGWEIIARRARFARSWCFAATSWKHINWINTAEHALITDVLSLQIPSHWACANDSVMLKMQYNAIGTTNRWGVILEWWWKPRRLCRRRLFVFIDYYQYNRECSSERHNIAFPNATAHRWSLDWLEACWRIQQNWGEGT